MRTHSSLHEDLQQSEYTIYEHAGAARFAEPHVIESEHAPRLHAAKIIICTGGIRAGHSLVCDVVARAVGLKCLAGWTAQSSNALSNRQRV